MTYRTCTLCKLDLTLDNFGNHKNGRDGLRSRCKACNRIEANQSYHKNPEPYKLRSRTDGKRYRNDTVQWLRTVKQKHGCALCGESELCVLDFHHIGAKDKAVTSLASKGVSTVENELHKCVVLCANCHRKTHAGILSVSKNQTCKDKFPRSPDRRQN